MLVAKGNAHGGGALGLCWRRPCAVIAGTGRPAGAAGAPPLFCEAAGGRMRPDPNPAPARALA